MPGKAKITIGPLKPHEVEEAGRIARLAFGTFLGLPNPLDFMGDRDLITPRWKSSNAKIVAARDGGRLIGSNVVTRWGSFGFLGPLTVLPEYWDQGAAKLLLEATLKIFDKWGVTRTGLCTFPHSPKHIGLYQKFGYWPQYLTPIMLKQPTGNGTKAPPILLSQRTKTQRDEAIRACARLTHKLDRGLDLTEEVRSVLKSKVGEVVLIHTRATLDGFAICMIGLASEGGEKLCFVKFGAARGGAGAGERFERLLAAIDAFAASRGVPIEAGVNLAREDAYKRMRAHGYRTQMQVVALQRPHLSGFNRADAYVMDDWR